MKERPILFSGPLVRALLAGTKTQTRRLVKHDHVDEIGAWSFDAERREWEAGIEADFGRFGHGFWMRCPYGEPGDRLWVKEQHQALWTTEDCPPKPFREGGEGWGVHYVADGGPVEWHDMSADDEGITTRSRPSIHMPRWASRITLEIVEVRAERLQEITEEDAKAEGVDLASLSSIADDQPILETPRSRTKGSHPHVLAFAIGWDTINGDRAAWKSNPWVWAISFRRVTA